MIYTKQMLEAMILPIVEDAKDNPQKATAALVDLILQQIYRDNQQW
jgi:serine/threonine protein phosphatase PrpC